MWSNHLFHTENFGKDQITILLPCYINYCVLCNFLCPSIASFSLYLQCNVYNPSFFNFDVCTCKCVCACVNACPKSLFVSLNPTNLPAVDFQQLCPFNRNKISSFFDSSAQISWLLFRQHHHHFIISKFIFFS